LLLVYRDSFDRRRTADTTGLSVRALSAAGQAVVAALDSLTSCDQ
jgi:hypothetical protein